MLKITLFLFTISFGSIVFCQNSNIEIGLIGGPEYFSVRGFENVSEQYKGSIGYSSGIAISIKNSFAFNLGLLYEDNHFLIENENNPQHKYLGQGNFNLFRIPVNIDFGLNKNKQLFMRIGIFTSIISHASIQIYEYGGNPEIVTDQTDDVQFADFGLTGGLGFQHSISEKARLYIILENNLGILNINKNEFDSSPFKLNGINLSFGISYMINRKS